MEHVNDDRAMYTVSKRNYDRWTKEEERKKENESLRHTLIYGAGESGVTDTGAVSQTPHSGLQWQWAASWAKWPSCGDARMSERALRPSQQYVLITHSVW